MKIIKRFLRWIFKDELQSINYEIDKLHTQQLQLSKAISAMEVSVDVHESPSRRSPSWAAISIQGQKADYVKFIELGDMEIREIHRFISQFDRRKVDATPTATKFLKFDH